MNVSPVALLIGALAVWEIVEIWQHSALMAGLRARAELLDGKVGQLLRCGFCLSVWLSFMVVPFVMPTHDPVPGDTLSMAWYAIKTAGGMVLIAFAVARLANLGNDLTHGWCRTPKANKMELDAAKDERESDSNSAIEKEPPDGERAGADAGARDARPPDV